MRVKGKREAGLCPWFPVFFLCRTARIRARASHAQKTGAHPEDLPSRKIHRRPQRSTAAANCPRKRVSPCKMSTPAPELHSTGSFHLARNGSTKKSAALLVGHLSQSCTTAAQTCFLLPHVARHVTQESSTQIGIPVITPERRTPRSMTFFCCCTGTCTRYVAKGWPACRCMIIKHVHLVSQARKHPRLHSLPAKPKLRDPCTGRFRPDFPQLL
jgi:hypothetical protein